MPLEEKWQFVMKKFNHDHAMIHKCFIFYWKDAKLPNGFPQINIYMYIFHLLFIHFHLFLRLGKPLLQTLISKTWQPLNHVVLVLANFSKFEYLGPSLKIVSSFMYTFSKVEDSISIKFCDALQLIKTNYLFKKFNQFNDFSNNVQFAYPKNFNTCWKVFFS
jgi:hypothetical protein